MILSADPRTALSIFAAFARGDPHFLASRHVPALAHPVVVAARDPWGGPAVGVDAVVVGRRCMAGAVRLAPGVDLRAACTAEALRHALSMLLRPGSATCCTLDERGVADALIGLAAGTRVDVPVDVAAPPGSRLRIAFRLEGQERIATAAVHVTSVSVQDGVTAVTVALTAAHDAPGLRATAVRLSRGGRR